MPSVRSDQRVDSGQGNNLQLYEASATADKDGAGVDLLSITRSGTTGTIIALAAALVPSAADDIAAAALNPVVPIGGLYRTGSAVKIRVA